MRQEEWLAGLSDDDQTDERPFREIGHPRKRAWLVAYALLGNKTRAAAAVSMEAETLYSPSWREDEAFQLAMEQARIMAADRLEDEAHRRAVEGLKRYKFGKDGTPQRHPEDCTCGHDVGRHGRRGQEGEPAPCTLCTCQDYLGVPYFEHEYSDQLLMFLARGALPERYADQVRVKGVLASLDMTKLPDDLLARIVEGEDPRLVLASALRAGVAPEALGLPVGAGGQPKAPGEIVLPPGPGGSAEGG